MAAPKEKKVENLIQCVNRGTEEELKLLLASKFPADLNDNNGFTPIHHAAIKSRTGMLTMLLSGSRTRRKHLANLRAWQDETPLYAACHNRRGNRNIIKLLITNGAKINYGNTWNETPLHVACSQPKNNKTIKLLVENGAKTNLQDSKDGYTPIMNAISEAKDKEMVEYLAPRTNLALNQNNDEDALSLALIHLPDAVPTLLPYATVKSSHFRCFFQIVNYAAAADWCLYKMLADHCKNAGDFMFPNRDGHFVLPVHHCLRKHSEQFMFVLNSMPSDTLTCHETTARHQSASYLFLPIIIVAKSAIPETLLEILLKFNATVGREQKIPQEAFHGLDEKKKNILRKYFIINEKYEHTSLKSACRFPCRKAIRSQFADDWSAYCWTLKCFLPESLKRYLLFQSTRD